MSERRAVTHLEPQYEAMPREALDKLSFDLFKREVEAAYFGNAFYRRKFDEAGFSPGDLSERSDIPKIPYSTKEEFVADSEAYPPFGYRYQGNRASPSLIIETGGTSDKGKEVHALSVAELAMVYRSEAYGLFWAGVKPGSLVAQTLPVSLAGAALWWHGAITHELRAGILQLGTYSTEEKLRFMAKYRADVLIAMGPYLRRMEYVADAVGIDLSNELSIRSIVTLGEGASRAWIEDRERRWGARMYEQYGCTQRAIFWSCEFGMIDGERRGILHFLPHECYTEVVDPHTGLPVGYGEEGEIVVTPFGSEASPIIRFRTGDRGTLRRAEDCPCGRPFDGLESCSVGRGDDMIKVKGVNVWQNAIDSIILGRPEVLDYRGQAVISDEGRELAQVKMEFDPVTPTQRKRILFGEIARDLRERTGLTFEVGEWSGPSLLGTIDDTPHKKVRRWSDLRR